MRITKPELFLFILIVASATLLLATHAWLAVAGAHASIYPEMTETNPQGLAPFAAPKIQAKAAFVYDVREKKVLYAQNEAASLPLASLTKLMTALVAAKRLSATTTVTIRRADLAQDGDNGLYLGERWQLSTLLDFTLIASSNDGAHAIAAVGNEKDSATDFVSAMNQEAARLGFASMSFSNPTGLDVDASTGGAYGSAQDMAGLFMYIEAHYPNLLEATSYDQMRFVSLDGFKHIAHNTDTIVNGIPGLIASKTGYTDLAGGNLVVEFDTGIEHPIVVAVLGSTQESRFSDVQQLVDAAIAYAGQ